MGAGTLRPRQTLARRASMGLVVGPSEIDAWSSGGAPFPDFQWPRPTESGDAAYAPGDCGNRVAAQRFRFHVADPERLGGCPDPLEVLGDFQLGITMNVYAHVQPHKLDDAAGAGPRAPRSPRPGIQGGRSCRLSNARRRANATARFTTSDVC